MRTGQLWAPLLLVRCEGPLRRCRELHSFALLLKPPRGLRGVRVFPVQGYGREAVA